MSSAARVSIRVPVCGLMHARMCRDASGPMKVCVRCYVTQLESFVTAALGEEDALLVVRAADGGVERLTVSGCLCNHCPSAERCAADALLSLVGRSLYERFFDFCVPRLVDLQVCARMSICIRTRFLHIRMPARMSVCVSVCCLMHI